MGKSMGWNFNSSADTREKASYYGTSVGKTDLSWRYAPFYVEVNMERLLFHGFSSRKWIPYHFNYAGPPAGGPPPPPPPPAFEMPTLESLQVSDDRAQLFAEISKGEDVTKGLKKVTADMQTHKNPNLRSAGTVPAKGNVPVTNGQHAKAPVSKPAKFALEGKKWVVEYQVGQKELKIDGGEMNQVVYVFGCKDSTLQVKGKLNSIVVDSCVKSAIVFDSLVASVEFVNCRDCQMQVRISHAYGLRIYI